MKKRQNDSASGGRMSAERRINWSRGFFRLWLVISLFWIVAFGFMMRPDLALQELATRQALREVELYEDIHQAKIRAAIAGARNRDQPSADHVLALKKAKAVVLQKQAILDAAKRDHEHLSTKVEAIGVRLIPILMPPAVLLVIGALIAWALRGFTARRVFRN